MDYYFNYLLRSEKFPQSVYHRSKRMMVETVFRQLPEGSNVLDAGCGSGYLTGSYAERYRLYGVDEQVEAINYCKKNYKGNYRISGLDKLPFSDNYFDAVLLLDTIEHLQQPIRELLEIKRVLKPGGLLLICTINYGNPLWWLLENVWHRIWGESCRTYSKEVHPTRYTPRLLDRHTKPYFEKKFIKLKTLMMELFYLGTKP